MGKSLMIFASVVLLLAILPNTVRSDCPSPSKVSNCTPKCVQDTECSKIGGKCCPNLCNARSCVLPNQLGNSGSSSSGYKGSSSGAGTYCGNVKCSSYEKCEMDKSTKRMRCVRT